MAHLADSRRLGGNCVFLSFPHTIVHHSNKPPTIPKDVQELFKNPVRIWTRWVCEPAAAHPDTDPF